MNLKGQGQEREVNNERSLYFKGKQMMEPWQSWKYQHRPLKKQGQGITATRDKWIKKTERGRGDEKKKKNIGGGMTDRWIKREAGLTWWLEDSGLFEKLRLRVQVPTMWLWPTVMQISPLRQGSPGCCPSVCVTAWLSYISFPVKSFLLEDQCMCVRLCVCVCVCMWPCIWVYWHKYACRWDWSCW